MKLLTLKEIGKLFFETNRTVLAKLRNACGKAVTVTATITPTTKTV